MRLEIRPQVREQPELREPVDCWYGVFLVEQDFELGEKARVVGFTEQIHFDRIFNQPVGVLDNVEVHSGFEPDGPEDAGRVVHETEIVQDLDGMLF